MLEKQDRQAGCIAVVLAGGVGQRFGGEQPKQYLPLRGIPVVMHSVSTFDAMRAFDLLLLVARRAEFGRLEEMIEAGGIATRVELVEGGTTRSESSFRAVQALRGCSDAAKVLVHDAARPLMTQVLAARMLESLSIAEAVIPGVQPTDAIVEVGENGICLPRRSRDNYRLVQTPQAFRLGVLREAYAAAFRCGAGSWDDDATVVSRFAAGVDVACVEGEVENFKITHSSDLFRAAHVLAKRESHHET